MDKKLKIPRRELNDKGYDIIVSSSTIKRFLIKRCEKFGIKLSDVAEHVGIDKQYFSKHYINCAKPKAREGLTHFDIIKIAEELGVSIKVNCFVDPDELVDVNKFKKDARREIQKEEEPR